MHVHWAQMEASIDYWQPLGMLLLCEKLAAAGGTN